MKKTEVGCLQQWTQGRINHSGAPYQRKVGGPFLIHVPRISSLKVHFFFSQKLDDLFLVVSERQHNVVKNRQLTGDPSHDTTSTMDNPTLDRRTSESL